MNNDSMRLVLAGGMIGLLMLSAAAWYAVRGPARRAPAVPAQKETGEIASASDYIFLGVKPHFAIICIPERRI